MEKQVLKKIDNIRNNLLHSTDKIKEIGVSEEEYNNIVTLKTNALEKISTVRAELVKVFKKIENKKEA